VQSDESKHRAGPAPHKCTSEMMMINLVY